MEVQISVHPPTDYVKTNFKNFLPDWSSPRVSVIIVLQRSQLPLNNQGTEVEKEKSRLRKRFIYFGCALSRALDEKGFVTDLLDPRSGYALFSNQGTQTHDDSRVVNQLLKIPIIENSLCKPLVHPSWGTAVYPGILMSTAQAETIRPLMEKVALNKGWKI
ncbi:methylmalonic aciduria and homocystinuria type D protein [Gloeothece citriformis]|nr:methylmalonic aciduria and homocystinuria type D protein [Gloeothece citriformis]